MSNSKRANASSSSSAVDYVGLCEDILQKMEEVLDRERILNQRQCRMLATRLSIKIACIREVLKPYEVYIFAFEPLLRTLYRYYAKAEVLVSQCGEEDWCRAAIFQGFNEIAFESIMVHVNFVGLEILECTDKYSEVIMDITARRTEDKQQREIFSDNLNDFKYGAAAGDNEELQTRLEDLERGSVILRERALPHLARYLLRKQSQTRHYRKLNLETLSFLSFYNVLKSVSWKKEEEPIRTWGDFKFLGAGSGASGVCKTSWLGVPCARKEFHGEAYEGTFKKEAQMMALAKHPCIIDFVCCGNGKVKGDRFIAMELMEKSLYDLIEERKGVHFSLDVALDIIWQIAKGVEYLHQKHVAHRDLKPQNVVVNTVTSLYHEDYYCVKLVDFGTSKSGVEASKSNTASFQGIGTTRYRAPEVHPDAIERLKTTTRIDWFKVDAYSFAMTCAHILTLKQPFDMETFSNLYNKLIRGHRPKLSYVYPKELVDLLEDCWKTARSKRPSFTDICSRLKVIIFNILKSSMVLLENKVGVCDTKEHCESKKEQGNTSYYTAQDISICDEVVSEERDFKSDVSKRCKVELE